MIALSFADAKLITYQYTRKKIRKIITNLYNQFDFLAESEKLNENEKAVFRWNASGGKVVLRQALSRRCRII